MSQVWEADESRERDTVADSLRPLVPARVRPLLFVVRGPLLGSVFSVEGAGVLIGRSSQADVIIADETVSRQHAWLTFKDGQAFVDDLASIGGTYVNGVRVRGRAELKDGDQLGLGRATLIKFSLVDRVEEHAMLTLFELTLRDPLTRAYNRRYFERRLVEEVSLARRQSSPLSLLLVDIDRFKQFNDVHGHPVGDQVLETVAEGIQCVMRSEDVLARYGGEEFVVIARHTALNNARALAERIRRHVATTAIEISGDSLRLTVSIGVATLSDEAEYSSRDALLAAVDAAMYNAKEAGRNCVCTAS